MTRVASLAIAVVALALFPGVAAAEMKTVVLEVDGMVCGNCEATVERVISGVDGVVAVDADRDSQLARVTVDAERATPAHVTAALHRLTYYRASVRTAPAAAPAAADAAPPATGADPAVWVTAVAVATAVIAALAAVVVRRRRRQNI
jgi:LPXTG-motif cell wall-anchored protein